MKPLIIIAGPTAVGKSDIAVKLAKRINGQIISADSMQVYRGMDIGSAKVTHEEMDGVKHYLIDVLDPTEDFNVVLFQQMAKEAIEKVLSEGAVPIIVGGTGFYIQSVLYDIDFEPSEDNHEYRDMLEKEAEEYGADYLFAKLMEVDPKSCDTIHKNNVKRVIRALEYYHENGTPISEHNEVQRSKESPYNFAYFVLNDDRDAIYNKIDLRVDKMVEAGLVEEVINLKNKGLTRDFVSMQGLGYKEIIDYLDGIISLDEALYVIKRDSRHFAKRQITWFKREPDAVWVDKSEFGRDDESVLDYMINILKDKEIVY